MRLSKSSGYSKKKITNMVWRTSSGDYFARDVNNSFLQYFFFPITISPMIHLVFAWVLQFFPKKLKTTSIYFFGEGGERRGQIRCIMGSVQMVNYSLGKRYIYHLESTIWIKDSISRSHSLTRVKNWTLSGLLHKDKVSKETTRNFAFCACPNFASSYFASGSEGREVYDL